MRGQDLTSTGRVILCLLVDDIQDGFSCVAVGAIQKEETTGTKPMICFFGTSLLSFKIIYYFFY